LIVPDIRAKHLQACELGTERLKKFSQNILNYSRKYESTRDERAVFAFMYAKMTESLAHYLMNIDVAFDDPGWIVQLAEAFAGRFIIAMDAIDAWLENGSADKVAHPTTIYETVPKPWADVYLAIRDGQSFVLEDMIFSMMAHISYDLPFALLEVKMETNGKSHVGDYHRMNDVLASSIDEMQGVVAQRYNRTLAFLDGFAGHYDEFFTNYGIRLSRSAAWYNACRMLDPAAEPQVIKSLERSTVAFIREIRTPKKGWLKNLMPVIRFLIPRRRKWPEPSS